MTKGIVLFAFGRRGYAYMAVNLAMSIKYYNKYLSITLYIDEKILDYIKDDLGFFDQVFTLPKDVIYIENVGVDPASVKINVARFLPYDENLYLDVDGVCVKDLQPLIDKLSLTPGYYLTQTIASGKYDTYENTQYTMWAKRDQVWDHFELKEADTYPAVQTSFAYFKKGIELDKFYNKLKYFFDKGFKRSDIVQRWGGTLPDELFYSGTCAFLDYTPDSDVEPIFFGNIGNQDVTHQEIKRDYYISAIYGNGRGKTLTRSTFFDFYDNELKVISNHFGRDFLYETKIVMKDKHANF